MADAGGGLGLGGGGSGENNTSSNVGTGEGLAKAKVGVDLPFKSLLGTVNEIILAGNVNDVTFSLNSLIARINVAKTWTAIQTIDERLELKDQDATPVADRRLAVIDGLIRAETNLNVEGRFISKASLENLPALGTDPSPARQTAITNAELAGSIALSKLLTPPEANATGDQTDTEIKTAYENNADTNEFDDAEQTKLSGIATGAEVNPDLISQAEAEAGSSITERIFSALRVKQAIDALGGGGGGFSTVYKTADEAITSDTTFTDDADLQFEVVANGIYAVTILIILKTHTTPEFKYSFTVPSGTVGDMTDTSNSGFWNSSGHASYMSASITTTQNKNVGAADAKRPILQHFYVIASSTAGTVALQWAQNASSANATTIFKGSWLMYKKLN